MELSDHELNTATYEDFADTVDALAGGSSEQLTELFRRVAFTVLVNNIDDHWKNHGFLRRAEGWRLSPAFDVNPSPSNGVISSRQINPQDDPRDRDIRNLVASRDAFKLSAPDAATVLGEVLAAVRSWGSVAAEAGISASEIGSMEHTFSGVQQERAEAEIVRLAG